MSAQNIELSSQTPSIQALLEQIIAIWPEHQKFINTSFSERSENINDTSELIADFIRNIAGHEIPKVCSDYRWTCERLLEEELYFRRHGDYRLNSISEAVEQVYSNDEFMSKYLNGLLAAQLLWLNHSKSIDFYRRVYLPMLPEDASHVEIGPGHGLLLYLASLSSNVTKLTGWDISQTSLDHTKQALTQAGVKTEVTLELQDATDIKTDNSYDSIVMSELLEHLENPEKALRSIRECLSEDGMIYVNVPVNSPAPDHIYLLRTPEQACELIENSGYEIIDHKFYPTGQYSLEKARKNALTISCVIIAKPMH